MKKSKFTKAQIALTLRQAMGHDDHINVRTSR